MRKNTKSSVVGAGATAQKPNPVKAAQAKTPTVAVKAQAPAPDAPKPEPKATRIPKYTSRDVIPEFGRMRVAEYQDYTFSINDRADRRLTDEELCADWQAQFPSAVKFVPFHVRGARRDFTRGVHSKRFNTPPQTPSIPYVLDAKGQRIRADQIVAPTPAAQPTAAPTAQAPATKAPTVMVPKGKSGRRVPVTKNTAA